MKRIGVALLLIGLLICSSAQAQSEEADLSTETAKQLLAPGWEHLRDRPVVPVVVFTVNLIELDSGTASHIGFGFEAATGADDNSWSVSFDQGVINFLRSVGSRLGLQVEGMRESEAATAGYHSWLVTLAERPVEVSISETAISGSVVESGENSSFQLNLTPERVDVESNLVLTAIELDLLTSSGAASRVSGTVEVGSEDRPVAVVRRQVVDSHGTRDQYFAMYLSANVVLQDRLPRDASLLPIGSVAGLTQLFELEAEEPRAALPVQEWELSLLGTDPLELDVGVALPLSAVCSVYGRVEFSEARFRGQAGIASDLHDGLELVAQLEVSEPAGSTMLRFGLADSTVLGDKVHLDVTYLPFQIDLAGGKVLTANHLVLKAAWHERNWDIWYQGYWHEDGLDNEAGVSLGTDSRVGCGLSVRKDSNGGTRFRIGVVFRVL
jgi:hypothetical protein